MLNGNWAGSLKFGFRMMRKNPGVSVLSVSILAIGIGLVTTMFSFINGVIIRGLPFEESERIVHVNPLSNSGQNAGLRFSESDFELLKQSQSAFEHVSAFIPSQFLFTRPGNRPRNYEGIYMSANALDLLKVKPILGRSFFAAEDKVGGDDVIIISHDLWHREFAGQAEAIGHNVKLNNRSYTVIGIMEKGFKFPFQNDLWVPLKATTSGDSGRSVEVFGRLKSEKRMNEAETEVAAIIKRNKLPIFNSDDAISAVEIKPFVERYIGAVDELLWIMFGAALCVLVLASTNVLNLFLARAVLRAKEFAVRAALGASRGALIAQVLLEALVIAVCSAFGGLVIALLGIQYLQRYAVEMRVPFWMSFELDFILGAFLFLVVILVAVLAGLVPAVNAGKIDLNVTLKDASRGSSSLKSSRLLKMLVGLQVALSMALLLGAGVMIESVSRLKAIDLPSQLNSVFSGRIEVDDQHFSKEDQTRFFETLKRNLETVPGIQSVGLTTRYGMMPSWHTRIEIMGQTYQREIDYPAVRYEVIDENYFNVVGCSLVTGRAFSGTDKNSSRPVAIVNTAFADRFWPKQNVIGKQFRILSGDSPYLTVVGVVKKLRMQGLVNTSDEDGAGFYVPFSQNLNSRMTIAATGKIDLGNWTRILNQEVTRLDPNKPVELVLRYSDLINRELLPHQVISMVFSVFGLCAVFLASVGIYGVISFSVNQRYKEFGIRMAIGALASDISWMIIRQSGRQVLMGVAAGLFFGILLSKSMASVIPGTTAYSPAVFGTVIGITILIGGAAVLFPAKRASRANPISALRDE